MIEGRASTTAEFMALFRALESARPERRRLFEDRFAACFLRPSLRAVARASRVPPFGAAVSALLDLRWPGARTSGVARTRLIDDLVRDRLARGLEQLVILGAGFDARALRIAGLEAVRVVELDFPATLERKLELLAPAIGSLPRHVEYLAIDFNRESLREVLERAGLGAGGRTLVVWEGVTNYLTAEAVDRTMRDLSAVAAPGSEVVFTYVHRDAIEDPAKFEGGQRTVALVAGGGEPWTFGLDPAALEGYLAERGLELVDDVGSSDYRARLMGTSRRILRGYAFYRVAVAAVATSATRPTPEAVDAAGH